MPLKETPSIHTIDINVHLGSRLRKARQHNGLSAGELGAVIGVSKHQIWKYENGNTPLTVCRLHQLATCLNLPMMFFYNGLGQDDNLLISHFILRDKTPACKSVID